VGSDLVIGKDVVLQVIVHVQSFSRGAAEVQQRYRVAEVQRHRGTPEV